MIVGEIMSNNKRITIYDIAEKTNFSAVTVHRALNNKGRISQKTKSLILETADKLGYKANPAAQGLRRAEIKIGAVLFCPIDEYVDDIISGIIASSAELEKYNVSVDIKKIPYQNNKKCLDEMCRQIKDFTKNKYDGIIIFASSFLDEISELSSTIELASKSGIFIATVANDLPIEQKTLHVGIDAFLAGQMAAELLSFSCKDKDVALLTASKTSPISIEYIKGFMNYSKENTFSNISIYEHYDSEEKIAEVTERMLRDNPNLSGIYITSASSVLVCKYIGDKNKSNLSIITTDLLFETPKLLQNKIANATIFQNPFKQGKMVTRFLYNYITSKTNTGTHLITPHIILSSNLKSYLFDND